MKKLISISFGLFITCTSAVSAASIYPVNSILNDTVYETGMQDMLIEITSTSGVQTFNWDGDEGGLTYSGGDTFAGNWTYSNSVIGSDITQIRLDAFAANAVFDNRFVFEGASTPGSSDGSRGLIPGTTSVSYSFEGSVGVAGNAPVGDLWRYVVFDFTTPLAVGDSFQFVLDSDKVDLMAVPIPPALWLFGSGFLALIRFAKIKK